MSLFFYYLLLRKKVFHEERNFTSNIFLPSKYGIGDFGYEAYKFIDILSDNKIDYWEILPINSCNNSPYSPISFYALNENFISLDILKDMNLIKSDIDIYGFSDRIDYANISKDKYYIEAYENFVKDEAFNKFKSRKEFVEYAKFRSSKSNYTEEYYLFLQYMLYLQWNKLKDYAHSKNVYIIGDLPIYPDYDSAEIMYNSSYYQLNSNNELDYVSGAPGDYFNQDGQKWGHPLYNFSNIKKDNYKYLIDRYLYFNKLFDITRIDHFKAYESYFKIPFYGTAKDGFYEKGPSYEFFDELFKVTTKDKFIIEDLGDITDETIKLKNKYNFKGMKILQYTLDLDNMIDNYSFVNNVVYTGNHDNNTIVGWYNNLTVLNKSKLKTFLVNNGIDINIEINKAIIKYLLNTSSKNDIVIIPVQDILGLDENNRINLPGVINNKNWSWKMKNFDDFRKCISIFN